MKRLTLFLLATLLLLPKPEAEAFFFSGDDWPVSVDGMGWRDNRVIRNVLRILVDTEEGRPFEITRDWIEDAAFLVESEVTRRGYLEPQIFIVTTRGEGETAEVEEIPWTGLLPDRFGRSFRADRVVFRIESGDLSFYEEVIINGLPVLEDEAVAFFFQENTLFRGKRPRFFTPARLNTSQQNLITALRQEGFRSAEIVRREVRPGSEPGAVVVELDVAAGPRSKVRSATLRLVLPEAFADQARERLPTLPESPVTFRDQSYTLLWQQDFLNDLRVGFFDNGFPDVRFSVRTVNQEFPQPDLRLVDLEVTISSGPPVTVGAIRFRGTEPTREATLRRPLRLSEGDPLNIFRAQDGRDGLTRLNTFRLVRLNYEATDDPLVRDLVYDAVPLPRNQIHLIMGIGTYEILRGGFEISQNNIWRRAHQGRLRAIQSFKATLLDYDYSVPDLFGENIRGFINPTYLRRDEVAFRRETLGVGTGLEYFFRNARTAVRAQYNIEQQRAGDLESAFRNFGDTSVTVASLDFSAERNVVRNPLQPDGGNKIFLRYRIADDWLGSAVDYHRIILGTTRHHRIGNGRFLHLRLQHGVLATFSDRETNIPLTERFYLGGESTVRGFRQNRASPRREDGFLLGAESYLLGTIQVEQRLIDSLSLNVFTDLAGFAANLNNYPFDEGVISVGLGLSYNTVVGPLRLEYAYNVVRREDDGRGALQIALGFPF